MNLSDVRRRIDGRLLLSVPEAGEIFFGVRASASYEMAARGSLPTLECGRRRWVPVGRLAEMLGIDAAYLFGTPVRDRANPQVKGGPEGADRAEWSPNGHDGPPRAIRTSGMEVDGRA